MADRSKRATRIRTALRTALWVGVAAGAALAAAWAPDAMAEMAWFRVEHYRLVGAERLSLADVLEVAEVPALASTWDDPTGWTHRIERHPLVLSAEVVPEYPRTLVITVSERQPVALVPTPLLEPVDRDGRLLPIDPTEGGLDYPILNPERWAGGRHEPTALTATELRRLAQEAAHLRELDPAFHRRVSELALDERGDVLAEIESGDLTFRFSAPISPERLRRGQDALADALRRAALEGPKVVDLRFADQVVIRRGSADEDFEAPHGRGQE